MSFDKNSINGKNSIINTSNSITNKKININDEKISINVCITEDVLCHEKADVCATHCHRQLYDDIIMADTPIRHP